VRRGPAKVKGRRSGRIGPDGLGGGVRREGAVLAAVFAATCVAVFALAGRHLDVPGLYYDEVIQATPASEFLRPGGEPLSVPGAVNTWLFGGWFPLMTQPYMGALKSQLLIPGFALFGATEQSLRLITLSWGLIGLGLLVVWARRLYGPVVAGLLAVFVALDPSFLFVTRHDWGSVSLALVCRGGGLLWVTSGWERRSLARLAAGGFLLGLGVYNKIDFAGFLAGAGAALLATLPPAFWSGLRTRLAPVGALGAGIALGALPMLVAVAGVLSATQAMLRSQAARGSGLGEKLDTWIHMLDGSYFDRLMSTGGDFDALAAVPDAASGPFLWIFASSAVAMAIWLWRDARAGRAWRAEAFALLATVAVAAVLLLIPRAARIHHTMNVYPFPQLVVALLVARLVRVRGRAAVVASARALAVACTALVVAGHLGVDVRTMEGVVETGGRGRWSGALEEWARALPADATVVSLDWGFHAPLRFVRPELHLEEPVWKMHFSRGQPFTLDGSIGHVYLVQLPQYEVFPVGRALLDAVTSLPMGDVRITRPTDRTGEPAFVAIQFARPHRLVYRGRFDVRLR
jgi:hypothetical protein